jgi:hypothetical protein
MEINTTTLLITGAVLTVLNYLSVFSALATLRWADARRKRIIANLLMEQVGERFQNEADFQNIINNMKIKDEDGGTNNDR